MIFVQQCGKMWELLRDLAAVLEEGVWVELRRSMRCFAILVLVSVAVVSQAFVVSTWARMSAYSCTVVHMSVINDKVRSFGLP